MQRKTHFDQKQLSYFSDFLKNQFGLFFPEEKYTDLERGLIKIMSSIHEKDAEVCIQKLTTLPLSEAQIETLTSHFTIGETYFFREPAYFQALRNILLNEFIIPRQNKGRWLRIWSAGCSSGEEAYSIAILVSDLITNIKNWNITILATDINIHSLEKLKHGVYTEWSFRNMTEELKDKYFMKLHKNAYEIKPLYKEMVQANYHNLVQDGYPSLVNNTNAMDIIFCRNLLMYFDIETAQEMLRKLNNSLIEGGYLIVSSSEHSLIPNSLYGVHRIDNSIFYQKRDVSSPWVENNTVNTVPNETFNYQDENLFYKPEPEITNFFKEEDSKVGMVYEDSEKLKDELKSKVKKEIKKENKASSNLSIKTETKPQDFEAHARELANAGKLQEALAIVEQGIQQDKCNIILRYLKALVLGELNLLEDAISELNRIIYLDPNFILAYFALGNIAASQEQKQAAKKYYSIVLSLTNSYLENDTLPGSEGYLTAGRMRDIIHSKKLIN